MTPRSASKSSAIDDRRREHVGEHGDRHREVTVSDLGVVAGVFFRGHGVVLAAHRVERHRNVESAALRCSLEQQVLEEVRRPEGHRLLITGSHGNPEPHRGALRGRNLLAEDADAARQYACDARGFHRMR